MPLYSWCLPYYPCWWYGCPLGQKILIMKRIVKKEQKGKKKESKKEEKHAVILKLPTKRLEEVKGKTLMRWHIKVIHINVNKAVLIS